MRKDAGEYATNPPCHAVGVSFEGDDALHLRRSECIVYRKDGVRVCDLLDVTETMMRQEKELFNRSKWEIGAWAYYCQIYNPSEVPILFERLMHWNRMGR